MASTLVDLVKITSASTGTGAITLGPSVEGYRGVEALTNGKIYSYSIQQSSSWEYGRCTYLSATNQITRSPISSSDGGTAINLKQNAQIAFTALAEDLDAVQLSVDAVNAATQTQLDAAATAADRIVVEAGAATVVYGQQVYPNAYASALPQGVTSLSSSGVGTGTGGTQGTYNGGVSGGPTGFAWTYTIGSDGKIASYEIINPGLSTATTSPTLSYPSGDITGATVPTATVADLVDIAKNYWAVSADGTTLDLWSNDGTSTPAAVLDPNGNQVSIYVKSEIDAQVAAAAASATTAVDSANAAVAPVKTKLLWRDGFAGWAHPIFDAAKKILGGFTDDGIFKSILGFGFSAVTAPDRDGPNGTPIIFDLGLRNVLTMGADGTLDFIPGTKALTSIGDLLTTHLPPSTMRGGWQVSSVTPYGNYWAAQARDRSGATYGVIQSKTDTQTTCMIEKAAPIDVVLMMGQSNTAGGDPNAIPTNTALFPHTAYGLSGSYNSAAYGTAAITAPAAIVPLTHNDYLGTSGITSTHGAMANALGFFNSDQFTDDPGTLLFASWEGGQPLTAFLRSDDPNYLTGHYNYANLMTGAGAIPAKVATYGRSGTNCRMFILNQGESGPTNRTTYASLLAGLKADLLGDLETTFSQAAGSIAFGVIQCNNDTDSSVDLAQWDAAQADAEIVLIGSCYHLPINTSDEIHDTRVGRLLRGEMAAFAYRTFLDTGAWSPIKPASATLSGSVITVDFDGPPGASLSIDTDWVPAITNYGVSYTDNSSPPAITGVAITGDMQIQVTLATAPTGMGKTLQFGVSQQVEAGWNDRRCQLMWDTGRISPTWRLLRQLNCADQAPQTTRLYPVVSDIAVS